MKVLGHKTYSMDKRYSIVDLADLEAVRELWSSQGAENRSKTATKASGGGSSS
jgi:hypothetical protein